jgi:hypothetical protein
LLGLLFDPEDEACAFFLNGSEFLLDYVASHPRKQYASNMIKFFHKNHVILQSLDLLRDFRIVKVLQVLLVLRFPVSQVPSCMYK